MQTALLYASVHHKNTEKIIQAISSRFPDIQLIDTTKAKLISLTNYDMIGIASGIYMGKFHKSMLEFLTDNLPDRKKVFLLYTCGSENKKYVAEMKSFLAPKLPVISGIFSCRGYDTYGPFKFIGGLNKNHPDEKDIENAVQFVEKMVTK